MQELESEVVRIRGEAAAEVQRVAAALASANFELRKESWVHERLKVMEGLLEETVAGAPLPPATAAASAAPPLYLGSWLVLVRRASRGWARLWRCAHSSCPSRPSVC